MRYGKINEAIWSDDKFQSLTNESKLLYIYLLSCANCTCIGIFQIGYGVMEDEFNSDRDQIRASIEELKDAGLIGYENKWLWFSKYLRWNMPLSPNHARQYAIAVHECVLKGAPVAAIWCFMSSARQILSSDRYQTKDGKRRSYWDDFKAACDFEELQDCLGGLDKLEACVEGQKYTENNSKTSTTEVIPKPSEGLDSEAADSSDTEGLDKGLASRTEAVRTQTSTSTSTSTNTSNQTRPVPTGSVSGVIIGNNDTQIALICSDGQPHKVPNHIIQRAKRKNPGIDVYAAARKISEKTEQDKLIRPEPKDLENFFLKAIQIEAKQAEGGAE